MKNKFAQNFKQLRCDEGLKQKDLAEKFGVTARTISYWESGVFEPDFDTLLKIAKSFNVSIDYLLGLEE